MLQKQPEEETVIGGGLDKNEFLRPRSLILCSIFLLFSILEGTRTNEIRQGSSEQIQKQYSTARGKISLLTYMSKSFRTGIITRFLAPRFLYGYSAAILYRSFHLCAHE